MRSSSNLGFLPLMLPISACGGLLSSCIRVILSASSKRWWRLAFVDNELDGSEWQVISEYARYWRCDLDALEKMRTDRTVRQSTLSRLFSALRHLFFEESQ